jgi:hypothetical protein
VAGIKADADERAYAVVHNVSILALYPSQARPVTTLTLICSRLREVPAHIDALPLDKREGDVPDELVPKFVMNAFVDEKLVEDFRTDKKKRGWKVTI